ARGWVARTVSADTPFDLTAVAIDGSGRRGPPATLPVLVQDDPSPGALLVQLARTDGNPIFEGSAVGVLATVTPSDGIREVRFSVEGVEQETLVLPPFQASLRMPLGVGTRTVQVTAVAVDAEGRVSAPAALSLTVQDDLVPRALSMQVIPAGATVSAGSRLQAIVTANDSGLLSTVHVTASLGAQLLGEGGAALDVDVPGSAPIGSVVTI